MKITTVQALTLLVIAGLSMAVNAEYYRWIDENGEIHYGDRVPAKDTDQGRVKMNSGGRVVESVERAKTAEELKIYQEQQRLAEIERQEAERQAAYDRALMATFTSVEDMEQARDERISLIEQTIELSRSRLLKQQRELAKLNESRRRFIDQNQNLPPWIERNEKHVLEQIAGIEEYIRDRELEKEQLRMQFNLDIQRFTELTSRSITVR